MDKIPFYSTGRKARKLLIMPFTCGLRKYTYQFVDTIIEFHQGHILFGKEAIFHSSHLIHFENIPHLF